MSFRTICHIGLIINVLNTNTNIKTLKGRLQIFLQLFLLTASFCDLSPYFRWVVTGKISGQLSSPAPGAVKGSQMAGLDARQSPDKNSIYGEIKGADDDGPPAQPCLLIALDTRYQQ